MPADLIAAARKLRNAVDKLTFAAPVTHVYNPLRYAWRAHEIYLRRYGNGPKRVLFLGMNPGPFGMAQTGVPFGQVAAVRDWLGIETPIDRPPNEHPKRLVTGFNCHRSEVSGERLWGLFGKRFGTPEKFFRDHLVVNYCPLAFLEESGRNRTPDKLQPREREALFTRCDAHLLEIIHILKPQWLIGVGDFAMKRAAAAFAQENPPVRLGLGQILHPSPACPASNKDWAGTVTAQLCELGVWK
ncbi:MAG TPA: uracil-DNA glycosylase family protein [Chthoniobacterales bacterium]|jgi:single-strand selective monofunctional uracil DNA glycosylase|nr:uracil-DNA glycosylase family protein [Chthoniobacterales bacterium]